MNFPFIVVPGELADCSKLKELNLKGNSLADKRLSKLVDQCRTKQVLDYVGQNCPKAVSSETTSSSSGKSKKGKKSRQKSESDNAATNVKMSHKLTVLKVADEDPVIKITEQVKVVRPHIVACIVKNLTFTEESFKQFIQLQTKLHEGICDKRNAATLATHDLSLFPPGTLKKIVIFQFQFSCCIGRCEFSNNFFLGNLTYTAMEPNAIKIKPLGRSKVCSGAALFQNLQTEAINLRKEKKRNVYSGIHKYLYLLEGKPLYPCVLDSTSQVISFPPITNSDVTKMSQNTKTMFVEVTSATSQQICRYIYDKENKN